ncbi:MAG: hypothetical protein AAFP19_23050, partial [Bacteroidota bacterium]
RVDTNPDHCHNRDEEARLLSIGDEQIHSLHHGCGNDQDWYQLEAGQALGDYVIRVQKIPDCDWPVDDVDVFFENSSGNVVIFPSASIVELNGLFIVTISCQDIQNNDLFLRVRNFGDPRGYYSISLESSEGEAEIQGPNVLCQGREYEVVGIPSGASVFWSSTSGLNLSCLVCNPTSVQSVSGSGPFIIEATVLHNGCEITLEKEVQNSGSTVPPFSIHELIPACYDPIGGFGFSEYLISNPSAGVTYNWAVSGGTAFPGTGTFATINPNSIGWFTITVTAVGPCGAERVVRADFFADPCDDMRLKLSPNPTREILRVEIEDTISEGKVREDYLIFVTDLYGEMMYQGVSEIRELTLDVSNYKDGVYNMTVFRGDAYTSTNFVVSRE